MAEPTKKADEAKKSADETKRSADATQKKAAAAAESSHTTPKHPSEQSSRTATSAAVNTSDKEKPPVTKKDTKAEGGQRIYRPDGEEPPDYDSPEEAEDWETLSGEQLREENNKITVAKQMLNTSDGTATEVDAYIEPQPEFEEPPEQPDYQELALELHDPEDVLYEDWPHAGVAEDDPGGVAEDDPAGSAPKDDNYHGGGKKALKSHFVLDQEERNDEVIKANKERLDKDEQARKDYEKAMSKPAKQPTHSQQKEPAGSKS